MDATTTRARPRREGARKRRSRLDGDDDDDDGTAVESFDDVTEAHAARRWDDAIADDRRVDDVDATDGDARPPPRAHVTSKVHAIAASRAWRRVRVTLP